MDRNAKVPLKVRAGTRVVVRANPAMRMIYLTGGVELPIEGTAGTVTAIPTPGGRRTYMGGPGGGLVYVEFDDGTFIGVSPHHLDYERGLQASEGLRAKSIRLARELPKGSEARRKLLAALRGMPRSGDTVSYTSKSGKTSDYVVAWAGKTRYGDRLKLRSRDGSFEFWASPDQCGPALHGGGSSRGRSRGAPRGMYECEECGEYVRPGTRCWETGATH